MQSWFLQKMLSYLVDRLREPSTWAALSAALAASLHLTFSNAFLQAFVTFGVALAALLGVIMKEGISK